MSKKMNWMDSLRLFISKHTCMCKFCACLQYIRMKTGQNDKLNEQIKQTLDTFLIGSKWNGGMDDRELVLDMLYSRYRNMIVPKEYFLYDFRSKSDYGRKDFVGVGKLFLVWRKLWDEEVCEIYKNKYRTYQVYKQYYGREVIKISDESDASKFYSFVKRHNKFIVKPIGEYGGKGIYIAGIDEQKDAMSVFHEICGDGESIVEELIMQDSDMAKFYPQSVNTVRFVTVYHKYKISKICAVLRMGRTGSEVDNATYGGIYAPIDMDYGIVYTYAESYKGEKYAYHPDTGTQILGAKIPKWEELNCLVEELVKVVSEQKMIGWDFALTPNGWIMIEANHDPASQDLVHDHGLRDRMQDFFEAFYE